MRARVGIAIVVFGVASPASADEPQSAAAESTTGTVGTAGAKVESDSLGNGDWLMKRKHTLAELELGVISLPNAPISPGQRGGNTPIGTIGHGDATATVGMRFLYRGGSDWEIGAGVLFAPLPTADHTYGGTGVARTHSRSYLWLGTEARYIPLHFRTFEGWVGFTIGAVVVADRFDTSTTPVPPILGSSEVTVRTEGGSVGVQAGGDWAFSERLSLGFAARLNHWILPATAACTPIGDCSTLTGPVAEIELGIRFGYRIPL